MSTSDGDDLPDPEIEIIRNLVGASWRDIAAHGGLIRLDGPGVRNNGVEIPVMSRVVSHFDRLVRIISADRGGLEVKRRGRVTDVKGARRLTAVAPAVGSFVLPLRLDSPEGELVVIDHSELETAVELLAPEARQSEMLASLPERAGDELVELLQAADNGRVDIEAAAVREGRVSARASITTEEAKSLAQRLAATEWSDVGQELVRGTLFRIDTRNQKIAVDVAIEDDGSETLEAGFSMELLEDLRQSLHEEVELQADVREERRPYERTARSRELTVVEIRRMT